jgi:uncharacterized protein (DUF2141 family)
MRPRQAQSRLGSTVAILLLLLLGPSTRLMPQSNTATLTVRVIGVRNDKGRIVLALFQSKAGFAGDSSKAVRLQQAEIDPQTRSATFVLQGLPYGEYGVSYSMMKT